MIIQKDAFNAKTGTFTIPQSGERTCLYRSLKGWYCLFTGIFNQAIPFFYTSRITLSTIIGNDTEQNKDEFSNVEFDKMVKAKRGDMITVEFRFKETGGKFSESSTSFTAYLLDG